MTSCSQGIGETEILPPPAGVVFAIDVGVKGLKEPGFAGLDSFYHYHKYSHSQESWNLKASLRHSFLWIPVFAGMTDFGFFIALTTSEELYDP